MLLSFLQNIRLIRTKSIGDHGLSNQAPTNSEIDSKLAALAPLKKLFPISTKLLTIALVAFALNAYSEGSDDKGSDNREIKFKAIAAGDLRSLALSKDGKVYATGFNNKGQLGLGDKTDRKVFTEVANLSDKNIIALSVGAHHSLALSKDGKIYATGDNKYGQLGLGDNDNRDTFTEVANLSDKNIIALSVGARHSLALSKDGKVYVAGSNRFGQLGLGDSDHETNRHTFTEVTSLSAKTIVAISVGGFHSL
ncbi:MAG: hypothetical protein LBF86_05010, partial [Helicobacteraceae bacterium]|nr:hypothetical protein [Helicobacteraceae bacterium]